MTERFQEVNVRCVLRTSMSNEDVKSLTTKQITDALSNGSAVTGEIELGRTFASPDQIVDEGARKHFSISTAQKKSA